MSTSGNFFDNGSLPHEPVVNMALAGSGLNVLIKEDNVGRFKAYEAVQSVQAQGSTSNVFTTGGSQLNYLLPISTSNMVDVCKDMILELVVQNGSGASALTLTPCASWFSNLNIECSGTILENIYFENMLLNETFWQINDEHILANQVLENYTYSNSTGYTTNTTTIAASTTKTFYLNLESLITRCALFLPAINSQITVQCIFNQNPQTTTSTSQSVSLVSSRIIMSGYKYEDPIRNKLLQRFQANTTVYSYYLAQREIISNASLSTLSTGYVQISAFSSMSISALFLGIRAVNAVQENLYAFEAPSKVDLKSNGQSIFLQALDYREYTKMALRCIPNSSAYAENMFMLPFSCDAYQSIKDGVQRGYLRFNPNISAEILHTVTGNRDIVCIAYQLNKIMIKNGQLTREGL